MSASHRLCLQCVLTRRDGFVVFYGASNFNSDISSWDTSRVLSMRYMFSNAQAFNADISLWSTGSVTDMEYGKYVCLLE